MRRYRLYIGTSGWSYRDWKGVFYPEQIKQAQYLNHYSRHFNSVEVDSTFYGIPRLTTVENWFAQTPEDFIFTLKVPQIITHEKRLQNCRAEWEAFLETTAGLKQKRGALILQFDYKFNFGDYFRALDDFLAEHAGQAKLAVEIRNRGWHNEQFYSMLKERGVALVLNDLYYMPRVVKLTAPFTIVRLLGNRKQIPDDFTHVRVNREDDLNWWAERIEQFLEKELEVYVYSNNRYQGHAPSTIRTLMQKLEDRNLHF
ncbi:DUF72 domain-containing protein [Calditrichota bacterium GD2]